MMGGVWVNTGTIPSKTLREAVLYLIRFAQRNIYGASYRVKSRLRSPTCWPALNTLLAARSR